MAQLLLTLRTPFAKLMDEPVRQITMDTAAGQITILPNHAAMVGSFGASQILIKTDRGEHEYSARHGLVAVDNKSGQVNIMCLSCALTADTEIVALRDHLQFIEEQLARGIMGSEMKYRFLTEDKVAIERTIAKKS